MNAAKPAVVGGFILGGVALGVIAVLLFGGTNLFSHTVHAVVYFQGSVANLGVGAPVTFRGVRVGTVSRISVSLNMTDLTARIPVYLDLNPTQISLENSVGDKTDTGFDRLLKSGLKAQLNMQSIVTGQLVVDLDLLPGSPVTTVDGDANRREIPSIPSKLQNIEEGLTELPLKEIAENARQALAGIQRLTEELPRQITPLAVSLKDTSDAAHVAFDDIDRLAITGKTQLAQNGDQLAQVLASSNRMAKDAETLVASLNEMTSPSSQVRGDLQAAIRDLAASASSLRGFTHEIERDPSAVLRGH